MAETRIYKLYYAESSHFEAGCVKKKSSIK